MLPLETLKEISRQTPSRIVLLVMDGLGGLPHPDTGKTELETARTPNLDSLASKGICGLTDPVSPGITPGSGPGHLALFGYDPLKYEVGRGILEVLGIDFEVKKGDIAARGNFATIVQNGTITDRRAGRISTEKNMQLCKILSSIQLDHVELHVLPVKEHRFALVLRGDGLSPDISDSDPQVTGLPPQPVRPQSPGARRTSDLANKFIREAKQLLADHHPANMVLLRGFSRHPDWPSIEDIFKLKPAAIAAYPMYRGLAKLVGMTALEAGSSIEDEFESLRRHYKDYDYFFVHVKHTDSSGEDGDFDRKVQVIEHVDSLLPKITGLDPEVLVITGDHSTPAALKSHSWHPVPILLCAAHCRRDGVNEFSERACIQGGLGRISAVHVMPLAMANALKLEKFGA